MQEDEGLMLEHSASPAAPSAKTRFRWRGVVDQMAEDIQAGRLAAGTWLKQVELERTYGCSRSDVRKSLDELVVRRLAQHVPNYGYRVFELNPQQALQLGELQAILEGAVADLIHDRADDAALARLAALATRFEDQVRTGSTLLERHATNQEFHLGLLDLCPNLELGHMARGVRARSPSSLLWQWRSDGWVEQSLRDHAAIVTALRGKDRVSLRSAMVGHIRAGERAALVARMKSRKDVLSHDPHRPDKPAREGSA